MQCPIASEGASADILDSYDLRECHVQASSLFWSSALGTVVPRTFAHSISSSLNSAVA